MDCAATDKKSKLCYLFLIFIAGCFAGWVYEEIFYWCTEGLLRNRGILYGPWLPIYGVGALAIYALKPLRRRPVLLFLLCMLATGVVEYIIGYISIEYFGQRLWDYRGLLGNIHGIVCLRSVVSFGLMGLAFHYLLEPWGRKLFCRMKPRAVFVLCAVIAALFALDCVLSALYRTPITY